MYDAMMTMQSTKAGGIVQVLALPTSKVRVLGERGQAKAGKQRRKKEAVMLASSGGGGGGVWE